MRCFLCVTGHGRVFTDVKPSRGWPGADPLFQISSPGRCPPWGRRISCQAALAGRFMGEVRMVFVQDFLRAHSSTSLCRPTLSRLKTLLATDESYMCTHNAMVCAVRQVHFRIGLFVRLHTVACQLICRCICLSNLYSGSSISRDCSCSRRSALPCNLSCNFQCA